MLVYGKNVAREVLKKIHLIKKVYISKSFDDKELLEKIEACGVKYDVVDNDKLYQMVGVKSQNIVLDIENIHYKTLDDVLEDDSSSFIVVLDHIEDAHNLGAIIRTCECAGVDYILVPNKRSASINATVMKTSSGALVHTKICEVANLRLALQKLKKHGYWTIGTDQDGTSYEKVDYSGKSVLIIGSEGSGMQRIIKDECDYIVSLPQNGQVNSLNASVACGIMIYEILKCKNGVQNK